MARKQTASATHKMKIEMKEKLISQAKREIAVIPSQIENMKDGESKMKKYVMHSICSSFVVGAGILLIMPGWALTKNTALLVSGCVLIFTAIAMTRAVESIFSKLKTEFKLDATKRIPKEQFANIIDAMNFKKRKLEKDLLQYEEELEFLKNEKIE